MITSTTSKTSLMAHCPKCRSTNLRRSAIRNRWERWRKDITGKLPYRCRDCSWRGWKAYAVVLDAHSTSSRAAAAADPPNLKGTAFARKSPRMELDLTELDRFNDPAKDDG